MNLQEIFHANRFYSNFLNRIVEKIRKKYDNVENAY